MKMDLTKNVHGVLVLPCSPPGQNEEDDWQENEELRAIEGLEGEVGGGALRRNAALTA